MSASKRTNDMENLDENVPTLQDTNKDTEAEVTQSVPVPKIQKARKTTSKAPKGTWSRERLDLPLRQAPNRSDFDNTKHDSKNEPSRKRRSRRASALENDDGPTAKKRTTEEKSAEHTPALEPAGLVSSEREARVALTPSLPMSNRRDDHIPLGWTPEDYFRRQEFVRRLELADRDTGRPVVTLVNEIDHDTPSMNFEFIEECKLGAGVTRASEDIMVGCTCRPENGRGVGCEYTSCECLEHAHPLLHGRKGFPYLCKGSRAGCLQDGFLKTRNHIFECNRRCNCPSHCKNKVVQKGRKVQLEIFKTEDRGWGLRTLESIRRGQFVDTYRGEIITAEEADRRDAARTGKESYLYDLDKFEEDIEPGVRCYVMDGEFMGGVTRFMNHSCDPNCRQFTVSYNHYDLMVYEIGLFAVTDIPAHTELTFDYRDREEPEDGDKKDGDGDDGDDKDGSSRTKCLCGSANCKGFLWV